jgi:carbon-monoxide dehydrogenase small subunit
MTVTFDLNGEKVQVKTAPLKRLVDILAENLGLHGTKSGCRRGECGACLVILDGELVSSCLVPAFRLQNRSVLTIEGLAKEKIYTDLEKALAEEHVFQCEFCRSGILMAVAYLLERKKGLREQDIRAGLSGNLCHCAGHSSLVEAVKKVSFIRRSRGRTR